tara:strand:- start:635 stop:967 length:333 start_codon:yes stop_codon:yes gene_type:complete
MENNNKTLNELNKDSEKSDQECLSPDLGKTYKSFVSEKLTPGTPAFLVYQLMSNFKEDQKEEAEDLISKTLAPADLVSHMLKMAETDKEAASAVKNELNKRLQKAGLATE